MLAATGLVMLVAPALSEAAPSPKVMICHATGSTTNESVTITVDHNGALNGHEAHEGDVIPAYSYVNKAGKTVNVPAKAGTGCRTTRIGRWCSQKLKTRSHPTW